MNVNSNVLQGMLACGSRMRSISHNGWVIPFTITFVVYALLLLAGLLILKQASVGVADVQRHDTQTVAAQAATVFQNRLAETLSVTAAADSWLEARGGLLGFSEYISSTYNYRGVRRIELIRHGNSSVTKDADYIHVNGLNTKQDGRLRIMVPALGGDDMTSHDRAIAFWHVELDLYDLWQAAGMTSLLAGYYYELSLNDKHTGTLTPLLGTGITAIPDPETISLQVLDDSLLLSLAPAGGWRAGLPKAGIAAIAALAAAISLVLLQFLIQSHRTSTVALKDPLTGLPNRLLLEERARMALAQARRDHKFVAVLFIDLDGFKAVNDRYGHATGDALLRALTADLTQHIRGIDTFARIGGDEFVLLLTSMADVGYAHLVANKLLWRTAQPIIINNHTITVGASIGISIYPNDGHDVATLLNCADAAMYHAKRAGGGRYHVASTEDLRIRPSH